MKSALKTAAAPRPFLAEERERELLDRCEALVAAALAAGAEEAEACAGWHDKAAANFEKGDLKLAQSDEGTTIGLRVFRGRKLGFAATNQTDADALARTARAALDLCAASPADPANVLPAPRLPASLGKLWDARTAALGIDEAVDLGAALVSGARGRDARLSVDSAACTITRATSAIATSTGVRAAESDALASLSISGMAIDGDEVGGMHYAGDALRDPSALARTVDELVEELAALTLGNLGAARAESYQGLVLFAPDAFYDLFVAPVLGAVSAIAVQRGRSPLAKRKGERIGSAIVSITDEPHARDLAGAGSFDREGQPTARTPILAEGVLAGWLYNGYAAAVEGRTSTGHASGGARSLPGLGAHAVCVAAGAGGKRADLERALGRGLLVQRFSGTVDPASGDFSGVAKSSRWVENGSAGRAVRETMLSGNAFALLARVAALSSESERVHGSVRVPWALVDGLSVTAG